eukprot:6582859-Karenia_brevis.AAC.1
MSAVFRRGLKLIKLEPLTSAFLTLSESGRAQLVGVILPNGIILQIVNFYCWTNGHTNATARQRTTDLIQIALDELAMQPDGPKMLAGDLNADIDDIISLKCVIDDGSYVDIGSCIHLTDCIAEPTCFPPNHGQPHRRDFVFISTDAL